MATLYTALEVLNKEVRLIRMEYANDKNDPICCTLSKHCLSSAPPFQALSYVWGNPSSTEPVTINGRVVAATTNLVEFLRELRHRDSKRLLQEPVQHVRYGTVNFLWIDALCIDQSNIAELNSQVPLMGQIYSQAEITLAWLGEPKEASDLAMNYLQNLGVILAETGRDPITSIQWSELLQLSSAKGMSHDQHDVLWLSIQRLLYRDYWSRAWTFQEMVIPTRTSLICGTATCDLSHMVLAACWLWEHSSGDCPPDIDQRLWTSISQTRPYLQELKGVARAHFNYHGRPGNDLDHDCTAWPHPRYDWDLLRVTRGKNATKPHDAIYAFLAVSGLPIQPDYNQPLHELYLDVAKLGIQCKRLEVVLCCAAKIEGQHPLVRTHSWVPEWLPTKQDCAGAFLERFIDIYNAHSQITASEPPDVDENGHLLLTGKVFDFVCHTGPISKPFGISEQVLDILGHYIHSERYVTGIPILQAILRTILCDHDGGGHRLHTIGWRNHGAFMRVVVLALVGDLQLVSGHARGPTRDLSSLLGLSIGETFADSYAKAVLDEDKHEALGSSYKEILTPFLDALVERNGEEDEVGEHLSALTNKTRLILTEQGYVGTAPSFVQTGDFIALSPHSRLPLVLRRRDLVYENIGPCFILGLMDGEGLTNEKECQTLKIA